MTALPVLISGAGPTGLTLAIDLARRGIAVRIIEAAGSPFCGSRGKGIQPRTLEVFDDLGVIEPVLAAGAPYPRLRFHLGPLSFRGGSLGTSKPASEAVPYPNLWMVPQARTEGILRDRLQTLGVCVEFGTKLVSFTADDVGVQAKLSTGEVVTAEYLVGCDGARSLVRKTLGIPLVGETVGEKQQLVADVAVPSLTRDDWHVWPLARGGPMGLCPLPGTDLFQLTGNAALSNATADAVKRATGYDIRSVAWSSLYQPQVRMVERFRLGRVFLAGDAAHVHPPSGGQGLNTGVQDAYNLGWKLAAVLNGAPGWLLDTYEAERKPVAAAVLGLSKTLHTSRSLKRGDATNQLALHYRDSPLASGDAFGELHAGDRMPDMALASGTLHAALRGPHATALHTPDRRTIVVRPDGYIASIGSAPVTDYMGVAVRAVEIHSAHNAVGY